MTVIDNAIYAGGRRVASPQTLGRTADEQASHGGFAWVSLAEPDADQLAVLARQFDLHPLAVEDALVGHQRAKLDRYGDTLFLVLRPSEYEEPTETVRFGEIAVFVGQRYLIVVRQRDDPHFSGARGQIEADAAVMSRGPMAVLHAILDRVVDNHAPVVNGLENDIDEIEAQLFSGDPAVTKRIYDLSGEVMEIQRAVRPLPSMIAGIQDELDARYGDEAEVLELRRSLRDVQDHAIHVLQRVDEFRATLSNALTVHATLVAQRQADTALAQTEQTKKISSWAAIIFAPSLITGIYGMNFEIMPELQWPWGYAFAIILMLGFGVALYVIFRSRSWL